VVGRATPQDQLAGLTEEFETKGGLNARTRAKLASMSWFDTPGLAFEEVGRLDRRNLK
jgi:hypothetical protein